MPNATILKETILVAQVGKWGVRVGDEWYGTNDPVEPTDLVVGQTYQVLVNQGKPTDKFPDGKKYINQIVGQNTAAPSTVPASFTAVPDSGTALPSSILKGTGSVNADAKSSRILWQGMVQHALISPAIAGMPFTNGAELVSLVKNIATDLVAFVESK